MFVCILAKLQQVDYITLYYPSIFVLHFSVLHFLNVLDVKLHVL